MSATAAQPGQGFDFLGYRFEAGRRFVRKKSLNALQGQGEDEDEPHPGRQPGRIIADLNPLLRGWFGYFKHARPRLFRRLDGFIRRRLRAVLRKQEQAAGRWDAARRTIMRWPNAFFADSGLFTLATALEPARHSR